MIDFNKYTIAIEGAFTEPELKNKYKKKLEAAILKPGFIKNYSGTLLNKEDGEKYGKYLSEVFSRISKLPETNALFTECIKKSDWPEGDCRNIINKSLYSSWKFMYYNVEYTFKSTGEKATIFSYDVENMSQEEFFYTVSETEWLLNKVVKASLGDEYIGKCYADDTAVFDVVKPIK